MKNKQFGGNSGPLMNGDRGTIRSTENRCEGVVQKSLMWSPKGTRHKVNPADIHKGRLTNSEEAGSSACAVGLFITGIYFKT